ncbi:hypothetical protein Dimus_017679 [Dionaea muscipula]
MHNNFPVLGNIATWPAVNPGRILGNIATWPAVNPGRIPRLRHRGQYRWGWEDGIEVGCVSAVGFGRDTVSGMNSNFPVLGDGSSQSPADDDDHSTTVSAYYHPTAESSEYMTDDDSFTITILYHPAAGDDTAFTFTVKKEALANYTVASDAIMPWLNESEIPLRFQPAVVDATMREPASKKAAEGLVKVTAKEDGGRCVICLEEILLGSCLTMLPCLHAYHGDCIARWLEKKSRCPLCRYKLPC